MRPRPPAVLRPAVLRPAAVAAAGALAAAAGPARAETVSLVSGVPTFTVVDLGPSGPSLGDLNLFEAPMEGGGSLVGVQTTLGRATGRSVTVQGMLTFDLPGGRLAVAGVSRIDRGPTGLLPGRPYERAVVGGTGDHAGRRGTVTSTRRPDGTYAQVFSLTPPSGATRALELVSAPGAGERVDLGAPGTSPGDLTVVDEARVLDPETGAPAGTVRGIQQVVSAAGGRVAQGLLAFRLADGDLLVGGVSLQTPQPGGLLPGAAHVRPVLGGTGAYAGATGTLTTTVEDDGRYRQRFELAGLDAPVVRRLRLLAPGPGRRARVDVPPAGAGAGDQTAFAGPLRARPGGRRAGTVRGVEIAAGAVDGAPVVASQLTLTVRGRGSLVVAGLAPAGRGRASERPVIGGTGAFAGAAGVLRAAPARGGGRRLTLLLRGPA